MAAAEADRVLLCPAACGPEAAWVGATQVLGARNLGHVVFNVYQVYDKLR
jgi:magnesium chelatase family protein